MLERLAGACFTGLAERLGENQCLRGWLVGACFTGLAERLGENQCLRGWLVLVLLVWLKGYERISA